MASVRETIESLNDMTKTELLELNQEIIKRIRNMNRTDNAIASYSVSPGDRVSFVGKSGYVLRGTVKKCNPSRALIEVDADTPSYMGPAGRWKVPYSSLKREV